MIPILRSFRGFWLSVTKRIVPGKEKMKSVDRRAVIAEILKEIRKARTQRDNSNRNGVFVIQLSTEALGYLEEIILTEEQETKKKDFLKGLPSAQ